MDNIIFTQTGYNSDYPKKIITWRFGEKVPEWISDNAKVIFIDGEGNITLDIVETSSGGIEILSSDGSKIFLKLKSKLDYVCKKVNSNKDIDYSTKEIFSLTPKQFELLYN